MCKGRGLVDYKDLLLSHILIKYQDLIKCCVVNVLRVIVPEGLVVNWLISCIEVDTMKTI